MQSRLHLSDMILSEISPWQCDWLCSKLLLGLCYLSNMLTNNKAGYMATEVAYWWEGAVITRPNTRPIPSRRWRAGAVMRVGS